VLGHPSGEDVIVIKNAIQNPKCFYGLHFAPGTAQIQESAEAQPYTIFLSEKTCKEMDPTFKLKPIFVLHVGGEEELKARIAADDNDGWVVRSFYNELDGMHWAEMIITSEQGLEAIEKKHWTLSNAFEPVFGPGGEWHGQSYDKEVMSAIFTHLAIVPNPRYSESKILTPSEWEKYNLDKKAELVAVTNSKGAAHMFKFFGKKEVVENSKVDLGMSVVLPKSKKEFTIEQVLNDMDEHYTKNDDDMDANLKHKIKMDDGTVINVGELVEKHKGLMAEHNALKSMYNDLVKELDPEGVGKKEGEKNDDDDKKDGEKNADSDAEAAKKARELAEHEAAERKEKEQQNAEHAKAILKAKALKVANEKPIVAAPSASTKTTHEKVQDGLAKYGKTKEVEAAK
jgi:hypothetical protein